MNAKPTFAASAAPALPAPAGYRTPAAAQAIPVSLESLDVYRVSIEACSLSVEIGRSLTADLRDQLRRASSSVVLNLAEGFGSRSRGVKRRHYDISRGSAIECVAILDLAEALAMGAGSGIGLDGRARDLFSRAAQMLARLQARFR